MPSRIITSAVLVLTFLCMLPAVQGVADANANGMPYIRLDKTTFASSEAIFFWVGVEGKRNAPIPKKYWNTCSLIVTRPDNTVKSVHVSWPIDGGGTDGPGSNGWMGGFGLGEQPRPGRYQLAFKFAGKKSAPKTLLVQDCPILKKIKAAFVFGAQVKSNSGLDTPVTLTVHNDSDQTIRFPHRDGVNGLVSVSLAKPDGSYRHDSFYPADGLLDKDEPKVPDRSFDEFGWKEAQAAPAITLEPGQTYLQHLSLRAVISDMDRSAATGAGLAALAGSYKVTFSTTLQILIGADGSSYTAISPVHIPVTSTATCDVAP